MEVGPRVGLQFFFRNSDAYDPRRSNISKIEREIGIKFEHVSAPQPDEIAKAIGGEAAELISDV